MKKDPTLFISIFLTSHQLVSDQVTIDTIFPIKNIFKALHVSLPWTYFLFNFLIYKKSTIKNNNLNISIPNIQIRMTILGYLHKQIAHIYYHIISKKISKSIIVKRKRLITLISIWGLSTLGFYMIYRTNKYDTP